ncbi:MAG TPA: hypothetical protein VJ822_14790 [Dongiaceae bacterium]|nr:hypothetical protein [Dongiaceae bacterium]
MSSTKPVVRSGRIVQAPAFLEVARTLWRRLRPRSQARTQRLAALSDHLLADVGLNRPSDQQPTWARYIHRH